MLTEYSKVTVKLERFSGVGAVRTRAGVVTTFNATVGGKRQYAVNVRGAPRIEDGMLVAAVLREPDNWQTLEGWFDMQIEDIVGGTSPYASLSALMIFIIVSTFFIVRYAGVSFGQTHGHHFGILF